MIVLGLVSVGAAVGGEPLALLGPIAACGLYLIAAAVDRGFGVLSEKVDSLRETQEKLDVYREMQEFKKSKREASASPRD